MGNNNSNPLDSGVSNFIKVIREYLDNRASNDTEFAAKYANPKKSVEACCAFIVQQIQKDTGWLPLSCDYPLIRTSSNAAQLATKCPTAMQKSAA